MPETRKIRNQHEAQLETVLWDLVRAIEDEKDKPSDENRKQLHLVYLSACRVLGHQPLIKWAKS